MNAPELVATGKAKRDTWLGEEEGCVETQAQEYMYSTLVLAIMDALPTIVGKVFENSEECGTNLWSELLRKYQPNNRPACARQIMKITSLCTTFTGLN